MTEEMNVRLTRTAIAKFIVWTSSRYNQTKKATVVDDCYRVLLLREGVAFHRAGQFSENSLCSAFDYMVNGVDGYIAAGKNNPGQDFVEERRITFVRPDIPTFLGRAELMPGIIIETLDRRSYRILDSSGAEWFTAQLIFPAKQGRNYVHSLRFDDRFIAMTARTRKKLLSAGILTTVEN